MARREIKVLIDVHATASSETSYFRGITHRYPPHQAQAMLMARLAGFNSLHFSTQASTFSQRQPPGAKANPRAKH